MQDAIQHFSNKLALEIDAWDLQEALSMGEPITVVDARTLQTFNEEHIASAISLPHRTITVETTRDLDRNRLHVVYCDGIGCNASTKGALQLARLGFRVKELIGGIEWWKREGYKTQGTRVKPALSKLN